MDRIRQSSGLLLQVAAGLIALATIALSPPAHGRMILLPLGQAESGAALRIALVNGAGLAGRGPLPGSMIISGDLARLSMPLLRVGAVLLAAPRGCGEASA